MNYEFNTREFAERGEKVPAQPIAEEHYKRFKFELEESSPRTSERNLMLFHIGVATGYRLQDLVCLKVGELIEAARDGYFEIQEQKQYRNWKTQDKLYPEKKLKKPKKRIVKVQRNLSGLIKEYVKGKRKSDYAFPSTTRGDYIAAKSFSDILKEVGLSIGLEYISGHSLRKTYAYRLYQETNDIEFVRRALGHSSVDITKDYLGDYKGLVDRASSIADDRL